VTAPNRVAHHFTVDVEEYFQVSALAPFVSRATWDTIPTRLMVGMHPILEMLARHNVRGTFFVLGWIAKRYPKLVQEFAAAGHEIASHGYGHERIPDLTPEQFRESVRDSKRILEDITGMPVLGYRAPSFSILRGSEWALETLVEEGYVYDSSLFPVRRSGYGYLNGQRDPHRLELSAGTLHEVPPSTLAWRRQLIPAAGGGYLRLLPYQLVRAGLASAEARSVPGTFYIHPWELDPEQPRVAVPFKTRIRHYGGLKLVQRRIQRLLEEFRFGPIAETVQTAHAGEGERQFTRS
jgi:polysaccharide deacetylase family protein (PEP-CTERM system associated)